MTLTEGEKQARNLRMGVWHSQPKRNIERTCRKCGRKFMVERKANNRKECDLCRT